MTDITNDNATTPDFTGYEICDKSGFRAYPGELVRDGHSRNWVLPRFADAEQPNELRHHRSESGKGPINAEISDNFITTTVTIDDL